MSRTNSTRYTSKAMGELVGDKSPATALMERWIATMQWGSGIDVLLGTQGMMGEGWLKLKVSERGGSWWL